jgi:hypothetical protein
MLRSCYSTTARFFADRPDIVLPITWYFCPPGAKVAPGPHRFGSLNWLGDKKTPSPIGEVVGAKRPWSNGATPAGALGVAPCQDVEAFHDGVPYVPSANYPIVNGVKACCLPPNPCFLGFWDRPTWPFGMFLSSSGFAAWGGSDVKNLPMPEIEINPGNCRYECHFLQGIFPNEEFWEMQCFPGGVPPGPPWDDAFLRFAINTQFFLFTPPQVGFQFNPFLAVFAGMCQPFWPHDLTFHPVQFTVSEAPLP